MEKFILNITASSGEFYQGYCESLTLPTGDGVYGAPRKARSSFSLIWGDNQHSSLFPSGICRAGGPAHGHCKVHRGR